MKPFVPSSTDLNDMIRRAMTKADTAIERAREERAEQRLQRTMKAETAQRRLRFWGVS